MADIVQDIVPDPDNAIYSSRVMGYENEEKLQGGQFLSSSDLNYWGSYNSVLSISGGTLTIGEPPQAGNQPYTSAYQTINVIPGRVYDLNIKVSGLNDVRVRILDGPFVAGAAYVNTLVAEYIIDPQVATQQYARFFNFSSTITIILAVVAAGSGFVESVSFSSPKYPVLDDTKWLSETWFLGYSEEAGQFLNNWSNFMFIGFKAGQFPYGWNYHIDLQWNYIVPQIYQIEEPDIITWIDKGAPNLGISALSSNLGWVLFARSWVGFNHSDFNNTGISGHTSGEGILCYSFGASLFLGLIKTSSNTIYIKRIGSGSFVTF
jgi:hypothetical protein